MMELKAILESLETPCGDYQRLKSIGAALAILLRRPEGRSLVDVGSIDVLNVANRELREKVTMLDAALEATINELKRLHRNHYSSPIFPDDPTAIVVYNARLALKEARK